MARRPFSVFSLSFLDCICCGFGAVILMFVLLNARSASNRDKLVQDLRGEVSRVEVELLRLEKEKVLARNAREELSEDLAKTEGLSREVLRQTEMAREELARMEKSTLATREHANQLKADLLSLEEGMKRLRAGAASQTPGDSPRAFAGDGQRQYLTGLRLRGERTLVLVDTSSSMLAEKVVDILRIRNLPEPERRMAPKWLQTRRTLDWILATLPTEGRFQVAAFAETTVPLLPDNGWWDASDPALRESASRALAETTPSGGTSLHNAFAHAAALTPPPDNILLLTDGLPTLERSPPTLRRTVSGSRRLTLFNQSLPLLPPGVPVNTLLFPMEGDPMAAVSFWRLAIRSGGSFLTVAEGWP